MTKLLAYHNDPKVKAKYLKRVREHEKADRIIKGKYWENGKGCAVGCTIEGSDHGKYETELGIPRSLAYLEDSIFERLPNGKATRFPKRFLAAIKPGSDLTKVTAKFMVWLLTDKDTGVIRHAKRADTKKAIKRVSALYAKVEKGNTVTTRQWVAARRGCWAAAADAAAAAAADAAAADAAAAAADAADAAARRRFYEEHGWWPRWWDYREFRETKPYLSRIVMMSDKLIALLKEAK